jgi:parallel beta-helix repeat protein
MKLIFLLGLIIFGMQGSNAPAVSNAAAPALQSAQRKNTRVANDFPGIDLGAKINAADKALGSLPGEIFVRDGGTISTQVIIGPGHTLRFARGTYRLTTELWSEGAFLLKSNTAVVGSGWDTIIVEPPQTGWQVFQAYESSRSQPAHTGMDSNISITNLQIMGANPAVDGGVRQTVSLGNCHKCRVEKVWFNATSLIGVQAGGSALKGSFADTVAIKNNLFTRVASQAVAVVNGRNIIIDGNTFKDSGRPKTQGMTAIDVEPNTRSDIAQRIEITNNMIDSRGSDFLHGNGILVQNAAETRDFGPVLIKGNTVIGGELIPNVSGNIATGIYIASNTQDVTVVDNIVRRVGHAGIRLQNTTRNHVARNTLISTGSGGINAFEVMDTTDSQIIDNVVSIDPNSLAATSNIVESGNSRNNTYRGNTNGRTPLEPGILSRRSSNAP